MPFQTADATDLTARLQSGSLSAQELMAAALDRIDAVNPGLNAIVDLRDREALMAEAAAADRSETRGALHGLPIAVKDLADVKGLRSSSGSPLLKDFIAAQDEPMVARMRAAGAIFIGKTNTPEFGLGSHSYNPVHGVTRNPYDPGRSAGGSSGGAAAALAAGMTALADGSDMMGSLRNPAAWNNVYGFRPTWGRVPSSPEGDVFLHPLSTLGPMARSPEDLALLLDVIAGPLPGQPLGRGGHRTAPLPAAKPARIGWLGDWGGAYPMEDGILAQCETALGTFEDQGHRVERLQAPFPAEKLWQAWITLRSFAVAAGLGVYADRKDQLKPAARWELERGLALSGQEIQAASDIRSDWQRAAMRLFEDYDALVLPAAQCWPFPVEWEHPQEIAGRAMDTYHRWMEAVVPVSLIGLPALAAPAGFGAACLPMGFQIFARQGRDREILALGAAYHAATRWPQTALPAL
jgi:amidase